MDYPPKATHLVPKYMHGMQMKFKTHILTLHSFLTGNWMDGRLRICIHQGTRCMEGSAQQLVLPSLWKRQASV